MEIKLGAHPLKDDDWLFTQTKSILTLTFCSISKVIIFQEIFTEHLPGPWGLMIIKTHSISALTGQAQAQRNQSHKELSSGNLLSREEEKAGKNRTKVCFENSEEREITEHKSLKKRGPSARSFSEV